MDDDLDPVVAESFERLEAVPVPDTWPRIAEGAAHSTRGWPPRRVVAVCAAILVALGGGAVLVMARGDDTSSDASSTGPTVGTQPQRTTTTATTSEDPAFGTAVASPPVVQRGHEMTVTPASEVQPICESLAVVHTLSRAGLEPVGQLAPDGTWVPQSTPPTWPACLPEASDASVTYTIPDEFADGIHVLCLTERAIEAGCATFQIAPNSTTDRSSIAVRSIEIRAGVHGGEDLAFVLTGDLPDDRVTYARDIEDFDAPGIAYAVQDASEFVVCGDRHFDRSASTGSIDVLIPSEWWISGAPVHEVPYIWDPPVDSLPDEVNSPGKIIGCGPHNGYMQYSIWSPASDDPDDVRVSVQHNPTRLVVSVRPRR